jgi:hypothetical protein
MVGGYRLEKFFLPGEAVVDVELMLHTY